MTTEDCADGLKTRPAGTGAPPAPRYRKRRRTRRPSASDQGYRDHHVGHVKPLSVQASPPDRA